MQNAARPGAANQSREVCSFPSGSSAILVKVLRLQGFGHIHAKKPTTSAATATPIVTPTASLSLLLNPDPVLLPPLPPAVFGEELGVPETVSAVVAEGEWASDEGCLVVVKEGGVPGPVNVDVRVDVVSKEALETSDGVVVEDGVLGIAESVVVERGLSWAMQ